MTNALPVNGRATDSQFAQNPLPLAHAMGVALAELHGQRPAEELVPQTAAEVEGALNFLDGLDHDETSRKARGRLRGMGYHPDWLRQQLCLLHRPVGSRARDLTQFQRSSL